MTEHSIAQLRSQLAEAQDLVRTYAGIINAIPAHIALLDERGVIIYANDSWRKFSELNRYGGGHEVGFNYLALCRAAQGTKASDARRIADGIESILRRKSTHFTHEYPFHSALENLWFRATVTPLDFGGHQGAVVMQLNTTERKERELALWHNANFDPLTNLPSRALLLDRIRQAINGAHRKGNGVALLFLDFDRFKQINDLLGHAAGDEALRVLSRRIERSLRDEDTVGRLSGDEFVVVLPNLNHDDHALKVARKLLDVTSQPIEFNDQETFITCSIGIAIYPEHGETAEILLKNSDTAMYAAKASGRHEVRFYSPEEQTSDLTEQ
jgi:diguanylate cyclase (GGDEF)-like protein